MCSVVSSDCLLSSGVLSSIHELPVSIVAVFVTVVAAMFVSPAILLWNCGDWWYLIHRIEVHKWPPFASLVPTGNPTFWLIFCRQNSRTQTDLLFSVTKPIDSTYLWTESFTLTGDFLLFLLSFVQKLAPIQLVRPTLKSQENLLGEINGVQTKQTCERIFNFFNLSNRDVYSNCPVFCFSSPPLPAGGFALHT